MTTDLEKQFFDTFGIEPAYFYECSYKDKLDFGLNPSDDECPAKTSNIRCNTCDLGKKVLVGYRVITDRILLELICIAHQHIELGDYIDKQGLIGAVLRALIYCYECGIDNKFFYTSKEAQTLKQQVQALFKE